MGYAQQIEDLWYILLSLDGTWEYLTCQNGEVIICNRYGQEIHAPTEESALRGAIGLYRPREDY